MRKKFFFTKAMNIQIMTKTRIIQIYCWWMLILIQCVHTTPPQAQLMSFCGQTLNLSSSSLSILYTPTTYSTCCNITLIKSSSSSSLSDSSDQVTINILNMSTKDSPLQISNKQMKMIKLYDYLSSNRTYLKSDILTLPIDFSLCQFNLPSFEILITNISKGPCKSNQYRCLTTTEEQWCIDEVYHCDGYHSCPQGMDENGCTKSKTSPKVERTIRGGIVTTIIIFGLLLIIGSVSLALAFVYLRRKHQRRRQFTYSLESTSEDWEPTSTGYRLFDNWTTPRRHTDNIDNVIIDANEHMPITTNMTNR